MLKRLKKLKLSARYLVANNINDQDPFITAEEWQLVDHIILLLTPIFCNRVQ